MDFAETLMSEFEDAHSEYLGVPEDPHQAVARLTRVRNDLLQALRPPKGDELTVHDRFAIAIMPDLYRAYINSERMTREQAATEVFDWADICMAERSRREAQP